MNKPMANSSQSHI